MVELSYIAESDVSLHDARRVPRRQPSTRLQLSFSPGHPTDRFGKLSVRKALNLLRFSKGNFRLEFS